MTARHRPTHRLDYCPRGSGITETITLYKYQLEQVDTSELI